MRLPRMTTGRMMAVVAFLALILALVALEKRASDREAHLKTQLLATRQELQQAHQFTHSLARDLLQSEEVIRKMSRANPIAP